MTEREVLNLLHDKLASEAGMNGGRRIERWIVAEKVRISAGLAGWGENVMRTADALAIDTWISNGLELHGFEVKCSRSDWLAELHAPEKSEPFRAVCDRWWLVTSDRAIVGPGELPEGWGWMAPGSNGALRRVVTAPKMPDRRPVSRSLLATMMRAAATTALRRAPGNLQAESA